jgi:hypothetical protein
MLEVSVCRVTFELPIARKRRRYCPVTVVTAREINHVKPLHWRLLTTVSVTSMQDAMTVINGYSMRWRIEEFYRAWKRGVCNAEDTQLRGRDSILKWIAILAAVAARAIRLTHLSRETPDIRQVTSYLSGRSTPRLCFCAQRASRSEQRRRSQKPSAGSQYTGKSSGGPPGQTVIGRGLERVQMVAAAFKSRAEM